MSFEPFDSIGPTYCYFGAPRGSIYWVLPIYIPTDRTPMFWVLGFPCTVIEARHRGHPLVLYI